MKFLFFVLFFIMAYAKSVSSISYYISVKNQLDPQAYEFDTLQKPIMHCVVVRERMSSSPAIFCIKK